MKKILYALLGAIIIVGVILGGISLQNKKSSAVATDKTKVVDKPKDNPYKGKLKKTLSSVGFNGSAILVENNKVVDSYVKGNANDATGEENTLTTTYEIDSLQKSLTAGLVMQQINDGKLKFTDKVNKYIPNLPGASKITVRQLLDMTSGLSMGKLKFTGNSLTTDELLNEVIDNVKFTADNEGTWSYQPVNFVILSEIIQKTSGKTYAQLFNNLYVKKLKLKETEMAYNKVIKTDRSLGYILVDQNSGTVKKTLQKPNKATIKSELGTGQVYMSVKDFYKVLSNLLNGNLLGKEAANEVYLSSVANGAKYYGGLYTSKDPVYRYANGYGYGYQDHIRISQDGKKAVVVFSNYQYSGHGELKKAVDQLSSEVLK